MPEKSLDEDWCDDCEMYVWNCHCDEYVLNPCELEELVFLDNLENYDGSEESVGE
jgi:hypothetical protein